MEEQQSRSDDSEGRKKSIMKFADIHIISSHEMGREKYGNVVSLLNENFM
jgi:hypothetical protein